MNIPRPEHPKPQFQRADWLNLNGQWQFQIDNGCSGEERGLQNEGIALEGCITVPFCPESKLSGVGHTDFMYGVWYKRTVNLETLCEKTLLHIGAADYHCKAFVNGQPVGEHKGGYVSFCFDITSALRPGQNEIALYVRDDTRDRMIPSGKQAMRYSSHGCYYTRTTGIWQTVWLEFLPQTHVEWIKYYPNITDCSVTVEAQLCGQEELCCEIFFNGKTMGAYRQEKAAGAVHFTVPLAEKHLWQVGKGGLYDVTLRFGKDQVQSYFGLRQVRLDGYRFLINEKSVFQRLVLDQGFYPDGIYTAPADAELEADILRSMAVGFNGGRLHEKVFEERFLYHADRLGYLVWGEYPDWGLDHTYADHIYGILPEWMEEVKRDFNHPAIVGWCPRNETWDQKGRRQYDPAIVMVYEVTKAMDPTRPCIDTSGNFHVKTDIFCVHDYNQDPVTFKENYDRFMTDNALYDQLCARYGVRQNYGGEAVFVSEYGGIRWAPGERTAQSWGYGTNVKDEEDFFYRFKGLTDALLDNDRMFGLCYTQLTDVEQEQNGLYTYDRKPKFEPERLRAIMARKAAIED